MSTKLIDAMHVIAGHLDEIERTVFTPGSGMRMTFIARDPNTPEADILVSEDDLDGIAALIERSRARENHAPNP